MIKNMLNSYNIITTSYNMAPRTAADAGRRIDDGLLLCYFWYIFYACFVIL